MGQINLNLSPCSHPILGLAALPESIPDRAMLADSGQREVRLGLLQHETRGPHGLCPTGSSAPGPLGGVGAVHKSQNLWADIAGRTVVV